MRKLGLMVLRIDADGDLSVPDWVPIQVAQLANDLYSYVGDLNTEVTPRPDASTFFIVDSLVTTSTTGSDSYASGTTTSDTSWSDLLKLSAAEVTSRTMELTDKWIVNPVLDGGSAFPASFIATYGLLRLDRGLVQPVDDSILAVAACVAGRCLGIASFVAGLDQGRQVALRGNAKKAAQAQWEGLVALRNETVAKYRSGDWRSKADFIRQVQAHVLAEAKRMKYTMTTESAPNRIRQWISAADQ